MGASKQVKLCLLCEKAKQYSRGDCQACLTALRRKIERGEITEDAAIESGYMLPRTRKGKRKLGSAYRKRIEAIEALSKKGVTQCSS